MIFNKSKFNSDWPTKKLTELGSFSRGKSKHRPRNDIKLFENGRFPLIQTGDVKAANIIIATHTSNYNEFGLAQSKLWPKGTLCITIAANIAETAMLDYEMCFPDSIVGFNANPDECTEIFMHYIFTYIKHAIQSRIQGSIQDNINIDYLTGLSFKIPQTQERKMIEEFLFSLDSKIEVNNKINKELESMAKLIYDYWFVQFDFPISEEHAAAMGKPEIKGKPYKSSGGKMVFNEELKREIPEGWESVSLSEWIEKDKSGDWGKAEEGGNYINKVSCIRGADLNGLNGKGTIKSPTRFILKKNSHKLLENGDFIVEISGGSPTQSTGRMALITKETLERFDNPLICSNFCKAVTLKNHKSVFNFYYLWNRLYDAGVLFGWEGKTSGIKNLLFESFVTKHKQVLPDDLVMELFHEKISPVHSKIQKNLQQNQKLSELRDWLLPMLMNGQVTVGEAKEYVAGGGEVGLAAEGSSKYEKTTIG